MVWNLVERGVTTAVKSGGERELGESEEDWWAPGDRKKQRPLGICLLKKEKQLGAIKWFLT